MRLNEQIEDLIEQNASDFEISKLFKAAITEYKHSLPELFEHNQGKDFLVKHTNALDDIISTMYKTVLRRTFGNYLPMRASIPVVVVALGSYGREQLCVHSDIDLMIVYEECEGYRTDKIIEKLLYLAWDAGLKLGHRVHEANDLFDAANEDITIRTALMESRFICGSTFAWHATERQLNKIRHFQAREFILAKIEEARIRREKHPMSMQPNVKEGIGGLRDSQLLFWCAKTIYGVSQLKELAGKLFSEEAYREYRISLELLFRVRSALHLISRKQQDQLALENMPRIAKMLGFPNELRLTTKVLEAQWRINTFTLIFVAKMVRPYLYDPSNIRALRRGHLGNGFYRLGDTVYVSYRRATLDPETLLEMLVSLEDRPWKFDPSVLAQFTYTVVRHPLGSRIYARLRSLFERKHLFCLLELLYDAGILHHLISAFKKVLFLPQFDGYHHYSVVRHSIKCVETLESIREPFIRELYESMDAEDRLLLKITTLLHDAGKGRKSDHSDVGTKLVVPFAKHLKLKPDSIERAAVLVRHHVLMSSVAFRENIHSEKTLYKFMSSVKDARNLKLLYVLTYADINGVGPGTYTSFGAKLLRELYDGALEISEQSERITDAFKRLTKEKRVRNHPGFTTLPRTLQKKIFNIESNLFFFRHTPEQIIDVAEIAREVESFTYRLHSNQVFTIDILRKVPLNLSYLLGKLSYLDVASMEVYTLFDGVKYFKIEFINRPEESSLGSIRTIIEESFDMQRRTGLDHPRIRPEEVELDCDHSITFAELRIHTANRRGLLAFIVDCFEQLSINIATAKIDSTKHRARDHFLIEKSQRLCERSEELLSLLCTPETP